jgi:MYXO-CTERM domain-containing protein
MTSGRSPAQFAWLGALLGLVGVRRRRVA